MSRVLETVLTGRNLLSPVLASAGRDVVAFNSTVAGANEKAAASGAVSARAQQAAAGTSAAASGKAATAAATGAGVQSKAATDVGQANARAAESATTSAATQSRAHAKAAESATLSARVQETANRSLAASNGLLGTSLTPLTAGLTGTALALGYAGYRGMEFGTAMSQVQAASQETGATLEAMRDAAIDAGAKTQYSAVEAAQGITEMSKAGVDAKDILGGGLTGALNLAAAGQMEVADAAELGATAMNVFNLKGDQMNHVADLLAAGAGKAQGSVYDLGMALNQSALVANATGLSIEETAGSLAMFASQGLIGSDAGTSFRQMLLHLQAPSGTAQKQMDALGLSMYDANGEFVGMAALAGQLQTKMAGLEQAERDKAMAVIFGADAVRASNILYEEGARGIVEWTGKVNDAGYAAKQAAQLNDNLGGDLERLGGAFDSVMTTIGSGAQGALREAVQALTAIVDVGGDVLGFWNSLPGPIQAGILALAAVAALKSPVSSALETIALKALYARDSMAGASFSMGGLKAAGTGLLGFFGGPWGLAITGAVTGLSLLVSWLGSSGDSADAAALSQGGLADAIRATGGAIDDTVRRAAAKDLQDSGLLRFFREWGVASTTMVDAALGQGAALDKVRGQVERYIDGLERQRDAIDGDTVGADVNRAAIQGVIDAQRGRLAELERFAGTTEGTISSEREIAAATAQTGSSMATTTALTEEATKALQDWLGELQKIGAGFVDPLATYTGLLDEKAAAEREAAEKTAAATTDSSDSWKDYVGDVTVSLDELATRLEEQLLAQDNWRANILTITQRGGLEVGQAILAMGEEGVQLAAQMADGTDAEFQRMAGLIVEDARRGGEDAAAALDAEMKVMAAIGKAGAGATRQAIADELQLSVTDVQRIADQYGINLATGINPILRSLGKPVINMNQQAGRTYAGVTEFSADGNLYEDHSPQIAAGGAWRVWAEPETGGESYIPHAASKRPKALDIWRQTGKILNAPEAQYYADGGFVTAADVPKPYSTAPYGPPISTAGDATMQKGFDEVSAWLKANTEAIQGGIAGGGAVGGAWGSLWNLVKSQIPQARINSTYRAGDPGYHGLGKAIDFGFGTGPGGAGSAGLASINRLLHDQVGRNLAELIYDGIGDDRPDLKRGMPSVYSATTRAQHTNHVHAAVADTGGVMAPGTAHLNLSGRPERTLDPRQTVAFEQWMSSPAAMPGYGMGGGWGGVGRGSVSVAAPNVNVRVFVDGEEFRGMARVEIDQALGQVADTVHYAGV